MIPTPYVASLRVFEPLDSFSPSERERWRRDAVPTTSQDEQVLALQRLLTPERANHQADGAYSLEVDGEIFIAPWSTTSRCIEAFDDFRNSLPETLIPFFIPRGTDEALTVVIDSGDIPHILTETWVIPPRWFALFTVEDRARGLDKNGPWIRMRTTMEGARRRASIALQTVLAAFGPGQVADELEELTDWLESFDPHSIVECDYGGLAGYLDQSIRASGGSGIEEDTSLEDIRSSLAGLAAGDPAQAGSGYESLVGRWRAVAAYENAM
ncbi:MAG TPA: hypothetical protein VMV52_04560 [Candidatus Nanopelagicaceae bacterium]|nr:hypothetical protein [Candidatus Nanopelagicaceae bacterium]